MKVFIPPSIRRIMEAYPPVEPLAIGLPTPPGPTPTIDFWSIVLQITGVFCLAGIMLRIAQSFYGSLPQVADILKNVAVIGLVLGLLTVTVRALFILRQQIRPNQRKENEYIQALAIYAQAEKKYYDRLSQEHTPKKVRDYRQAELVSLKKKLPSFDFAVSNKNNDSLSSTFSYFKELSHVFYQPVVNIPGIDQSYIPEFILQNENKTITIVVDLENKALDQSLLREFYSQRGLISIVLSEAELTSGELQNELNHLWQRIGF